MVLDRQGCKLQHWCCSASSRYVIPPSTHVFYRNDSMLPTTKKFYIYLKLYCSGIFYVDKRQEDTVQCKANGLMLSFQYSVILICLLCIFHYVVSFYLIKVSDFSVQLSYCVWFGIGNSQENCWNVFGLCNWKTGKS